MSDILIPLRFLNLKVSSFKARKIHNEFQIHNS